MSDELYGKGLKGILIYQAKPFANMSGWSQWKEGMSSIIDKMPPVAVLLCAEGKISKKKFKVFPNGFFFNHNQFSLLFKNKLRNISLVISGNPVLENYQKKNA